MSEQQDAAARLVAEWWPYDFDAASMLQKRAELEERIRQLVAAAVAAEREACAAVANGVAARYRETLERKPRDQDRELWASNAMCAAEECAADIRARGSE